MLTELQKKITNGEKIILSEIKPPQSGEAELLHTIAKKYEGKICALGVSDNREEICMSSMAASTIIQNAGVEPIMHMITRDKNRIALVSDYLGAQSLGIGNLLITSGTHQSLHNYRKAKSVYDIDSIQLAHLLTHLSVSGKELGEQKIKNNKKLCIGGAADPFADPIDMQIIKLEKKISAGAEFIITKPVFSIEGFKTWWDKVKAKNLHKSTAIIAGIRILTSAEEAEQLSKSRPDPRIPQSIIDRFGSKKDAESMKEEGIAIALETIKELTELQGLRGFEITSNDDYTTTLAVLNNPVLNG